MSHMDVWNLSSTAYYITDKSALRTTSSTSRVGESRSCPQTTLVSGLKLPPVMGSTAAVLLPKTDVNPFVLHCF